MSTRKLILSWRWLLFAAILLSAGTLSIAAARHELAAHWAASSDPELRLRAAEIEPANPELWYELGRYRQLDLEHSDLPLAISYYRRAISLNPHSSSYWMDLAAAYEAIGDISQSEEAFRTARKLSPISAEAAWRFGNFLLRQGRAPEAFGEIHDALMVDPKLTASAVSVCWLSTRDIDQILRVLPDVDDENWAAIQFFAQAREPLPAVAIWKRIAARRESAPLSSAFGLLDMLIETGHADDAQTVWTEALSAAGIPPTTDSSGSLIWNGGFERQPLQGGFDWRIQPIEGASIGWDEQIMHSGGRSLRVDFDGNANVNFENVWQYVAVQPARPYHFSAFSRTEDLSTDSGIRFEIRDVSHPENAARLTANLVGTQSWTKEEMEFVTGPQTRVLQIVLRRTRSEKLANKIRGTAWIDDVALVPLPSGLPR